MGRALDTISRVLGTVAVAASLAGCMAAQQQETLTAIAGIKVELAQLNDRCRANLASSDLDLLRDKVELSRTDWSAPTPFSMLTNNATPTPAERQAIARWGSIRDACQAGLVQYARSAPSLAKFPEGDRERVIRVGGVWATANNSLAADLYDGRIGYAEFNWRRAKLNAEGDKAVNAWVVAMVTRDDPREVGYAQAAEHSLLVALNEPRPTAPATAAAPSYPVEPTALSEVALEKRGGSYWVRAEINRTASLRFVVDTGAESLVIPFHLAEDLIVAGAITPRDTLVDSVRIEVAGGSRTVGAAVNIREVRVGDWIARNVEATIVRGGEPLLGQSVLARFGSVTVDYKRLVLVLSR